MCGLAGSHAELETVGRRGQRAGCLPVGDTDGMVVLLVAATFERCKTTTRGHALGENRSLVTCLGKRRGRGELAVVIVAAIEVALPLHVADEVVSPLQAATAKVTAVHHRRRSSEVTLGFS
uniref:Uncharacterized protein n=1 Tax=Oryza meridionalis TaxID=40149 RepID=A0A0E0C7L1_9ORYZ